MNKPTRRSITELQQKNFVDFLYETYEREKNSAGDCYATPLEYITDEKTYLSSDVEKEFVEEYGFAPIGFLEALRVQIPNPLVLAICTRNASKNPIGANPYSSTNSFSVLDDK